MSRRGAEQIVLGWAALAMACGSGVDLRSVESEPAGAAVQPVDGVGDDASTPLPGTSAGSAGVDPSQENSEGGIGSLEPEAELQATEPTTPGEPPNAAGVSEFDGPTSAPEPAQAPEPAEIIEPEAPAQAETEPISQDMSADAGEPEPLSDAGAGPEPTDDTCGAVQVEMHLELYLSPSDADGRLFRVPFDLGGSDPDLFLVAALDAPDWLFVDPEVSSTEAAEFWFVEYPAGIEMAEFDVLLSWGDTGCPAYRRHVILQLAAPE
jgi:hypothetical protein